MERNFNQQVSPTASFNPGLHHLHRDTSNMSDAPECPTHQNYSLSYYPSTFYWKPAFSCQGSPPLRPQLVNLCLFYKPRKLIKQEPGIAFGETRRTLEQHDEGTDLATGSLSDFTRIKAETFYPPRQYSTDAEPIDLSPRKCKLHFFS